MENTLIIGAGVAGVNAATKAIREKTGYKGFFKSEGGLMAKGKKKK